MIPSDNYGTPIISDVAQLNEPIENITNYKFIKMICTNCNRTITVQINEAKRVFKENNCNFCNHE